MTKTVHVCDCCGKETSGGELYECCRELRTWKGYKCVPKKWELCLSCIEHLEDVLESEIQRAAAWSSRCAESNR